MSNLPKATEGGNLLIVDDDLVARQMLELMLKNEGYQVRCAPNGQTALLFASEDPPDLILLDIKLPDIDGLEVCRRLKSDRRTSATPVIFLSVSEDVEIKIKGFAEGAVDYMAKPLRIEEVLTRVRTHLSLYHLQKNLARAIEEHNADLAQANRRSSSVNAELQAEINQRIQAEQLLRERLEFEILLSELSALFIDIPHNQIDAAIETSLKQLLEYFQVDRCGLVRISFDEMTWRVIYAALAPGISQVAKNIDFPIAMHPWIFQKVIKQHEIVHFTSLEELPPEAEIDKQSYKEMGIRSSITIPITVRGSCEYIITFNAVHSELSWPLDYIRRLRLMGEIFIGALERRKARQELELQLNFQEFLSRMSAEFITLKAQRADSQIKNGLRELVRFFDVDRATLAQPSDEKGNIAATHIWVQPDAAAPPLNVSSTSIPWITGQVIGGNPVIIEDVAELAGDAIRDREFLSGLGVKSGIYLPLNVSGEYLGFLSLTDLRAKRSWPAKQVTILQLAGDVLANALARKHSEMAGMAHLKEIKRLKQQAEQENIYLREEINLQEIHRSIICESTSMKRVLAQVEQVAHTDATVLIQGETGTGKGLMAGTIHDLSARKARPFITVNCASLSSTLIESELFGREKGAYTGAMTRMAGRFEVADGSTLFLDEIGELPLDIQSKLLRVLEQGNFERLGSTRTIHVDVRVIAATNRDLVKETAEGKFRKDLYYRLNVFPITIPPLRERLEDIPPLVWAFVRNYRTTLGKQVDHIPRKSMEALKRHAWPGNARELRNIVEHAMIISCGKALEVALPQMPIAESQAKASLEDVERGHILNVLGQCGWRIAGTGGAAERLGIKRTTLQSKMKKLGIRQRTFKMVPK